MIRERVWRVLKWFFFRLDPETAHRMTARLIRLGIRMGNAPLRIASGASRRKVLPGEAPQVFGMSFASRVGLAAGFDKDAEMVEGLPALGFGFCEIGTVTPRPQPGNERPRLFREPAREALFNRMGFNGLGATVVAERLAQSKPRLPESFRVGVNLGKNKDTSLENAADDYILAAKAFRGLADYLVINVSSPNTPGLRSLQTVEALRPIVEGVGREIARWTKRPPLLLKLAPELSGMDLEAVIRGAESWGIDGWVLTNTLGGAWSKGLKQELPGGWSGAPVRDASRASLKQARALTKLPIVSVGGIFDAEEAMARRELGADLVQLYSGWIYRGPGLPFEVSRRLR